MHKNIRIAITGPESTGKTTLTEYLAARFGGFAVPEFARAYLENTGRPYNYNDILHIAQQQILSEDQAAKTNEMVFCDTELLVTKIWCDDKFGRCHSWIIEELQQRDYDLVLLCNTDMPWEPDPQREDPDRREYLMNLYRNQVVTYYKNVVEISHDGDERLKMACSAVEEFLKSKSCL
ncbi:AAA domain protein [anaerobic digester metagenome]